MKKIILSAVSSDTLNKSNIIKFYIKIFDDFVWIIYTGVCFYNDYVVALISECSCKFSLLN